MELRKDGRTLSHLEMRGKSAAATALILASSLFMARPLMAQTAGICPANETIVTSQNAEVNWKKTHVAIINGDDYEDRHKKNAGLAAKAAIGKGCATVHVAGQMENTTGDIKTYGGTSAGVTAMIQAIGKSSAEGETVLIYVTGHGAENGFGLEKSEGIEHKDFLKLLEDNFSGRRIVFIADSCYSAAFVNMIMESGKLKDVIAMSPGLKNEETSCEYFSYPFWHAIIKGLDVNGNGLATLDEAFYYALRKYREVKPGTDGTYRETLPTVKTIEEVRDGVIMITTDWCGSCKAMYPTFNLTKVRLKGMVEFYAMDVTEGGFDGPVPTLIIRKAGKTVAKSVGAMGFKEFTKWLAKNGVRAGQDGISLKDLYEQGRFDSIVQIFSWQEIRKEIGEQQAAEMAWALLSHDDPNTRRAIINVLGDAAWAGQGVEPFFWKLGELMSDSDKAVRGGASKALTFAAVNTKTRPVALSILKMKLTAPQDLARANAIVALEDAAESGVDMQPFIEDVGKMLQDASAGVRESAISFLGKAGGSELNVSAYISTIGKLLKDPSAEVRGIAAWAIGEMAEAKQSVGWLLPDLGAMLSDPDMNVRKYTARAIGRLGKAGTGIYPYIYTFAAMLGDEDEGIRYAGAAALGDAAEGGSDISGAALPLAKATKDKSEFVKDIAKTAMKNAIAGRTYSNVFLGMLLGGLNENDITTQEGIIIALVDVFAKDKECRSTTLNRLSETLASADEIIARNSARVIGKIAADKKSRALAFRIMKGGMGSSEAAMRAASAEAVGYAAIAEAPVGPLTKKLMELADDPDLHVRVRAIDALSYAYRYVKEKRTLLRVLGEAMTDSDAVVRTTAVDSLWDANASLDYEMSLMFHMESAKSKLKQPDLGNDGMVAALGKMLDCPLKDVKKAAAAGLRWLESMGADISPFVDRLKAYR